MTNICTNCDMDGAQYFGDCEICKKDIYVCNLCMPQIQTKYQSYEEQIISFHKDIHHGSVDLV